ncbi:MAG TPA: hypothetical protein VJM33_02330, partial [Microthrixaceae bacterium]|nr:hypothetical protein [Microthrixaceae bacterium]
LVRRLPCVGVDGGNDNGGWTTTIACAVTAVLMIAMGFFGSLMIENERVTVANIVLALIWTLVAIVLASLGWRVGQNWRLRRARPSDD